MVIYWRNNSIKKKTEGLAAENFRVAKRMGDIVAAVNFLDLVPASSGRAHFLKGKYSDNFAVDILDSIRTFTGQKTKSGKRVVQPGIHKGYKLLDTVLLRALETINIKNPTLSKYSIEYNRDDLLFGAKTLERIYKEINFKPSGSISNTFN